MHNGLCASARRFATSPYAMGIFKQKMFELMHARTLSKEEMRKFAVSEGDYASAKGFLAMIKEAALADAAATPNPTSPAAATPATPAPTATPAPPRTRKRRQLRGSTTPPAKIEVSTTTVLRWMHACDAVYGKHVKGYTDRYVATNSMTATRCDGAA